ncbi:MAG TPA: electron-transfer flavoprotein:ubiquinone oxidoreductase [Solirubrobacteraceae bacterium]|nr:electron-transfer flavoprotein:ubiquinone oxidoreductase [Solirubrobacteraceae bacterium]
MAQGNGRGPVAPSEFAPPVDSVKEFVKRELDPEEERIDVGVVIVGGGPAGLACANRLLQLLADDPDLMERLGEVPVAVIEKGKACGAHNLSGAMMRPSGLKELFPDVPESEWPTHGTVDKDSVYWMLGPNAKLPLKPTPPPFRNHGNHMVSVAEMSRWLAARAEEAGAYILTETAASQLLVTDRVVRGIRSGDKGRGKEGEELGNFEPGSDVTAKATVLAEGTWGHLTGAAIREFELASGREPQVWALGVKEVWQVEKPLDRVIHTLGWPLRYGAKWHEFGGSWIYPMGSDRVSIGFVVGLDYTDATVSPHDLLQLFKTSKLVRGILEGGKRVAWGAKAIPEGGYWAMPKPSAPGMVICGDSAGMVNVPILKGIHYAIHAGIYAAETIFKTLKAGGTDLSEYDKRVEDSLIGKELYQSRNMKQPFGRGFFVGGAITNAMVVSKGRFPGGRWANHRDADSAMTVDGARKAYPKPDGKYIFDKLSSVYVSGNATRDDAPNHIRVRKNVPREIAETWQWMCPAGVYEIPDDAPESGPVDVVVNYTNCVQCGAITAKGGRLTPPEGGDGPLYTVT